MILMPSIRTASLLKKHQATSVLSRNTKTMKTSFGSDEHATITDKSRQPIMAYLKLQKREGITLLSLDYYQRFLQIFMLSFFQDSMVLYEVGVLQRLPALVIVVISVQLIFR